MSNNLWDNWFDASSNCKTRIHAPCEIKRSRIIEDILTGRKLFQNFRENT